MLGNCLENVRKSTPLVHNITNYVTVKHNVMELKGSGICGIAVISAIFAAKDIRSATAELKELTEQVVSV